MIKIRRFIRKLYIFFCRVYMGTYIYLGIYGVLLNILFYKSIV